MSADSVETVKWWVKAAELGNAKAQFKLAVMYENGDGVAKDFAEAAKWHRKAAKQGHADAQFFLGLSYKNGDGVTADTAEAVKWWSKAAEQGHAKAQNRLRNMSTAAGKSTAAFTGGLTRPDGSVDWDGWRHFYHGGGQEALAAQLRGNEPEDTNGIIHRTFKALTNAKSEKRSKSLKSAPEESPQEETQIGKVQNPELKDEDFD